MPTEPSLPTPRPGVLQSGRLATALLGLAVSALFTWLALRHVDAGSVRAAWSTARWEWVVLYVAAAIGIQGLRMGRWSLLLWWLGEKRVARSMAVGAVGLAAVFILPARLGEFVRPMLIAHPRGVRMAQAVASIVAERMLDGVLVGLMLVLAGTFAEGDVSSGSMLRTAGWTVGGAFLAVGAAIWVAASLSDAWRDSLRRHLRSTPRIAKGVDVTIARFRGGLLALGRPAHACSYGVISALMWGLNGLSLLLLFRAFALDLPPAAAFVVLGVQAVGILAPAAPTSVGTFHFAVVWGLGLYGQAESPALGFAAVYHLCQVVANLLVGLSGLAAGGMRVGDFTERLQHVETPHRP